MTLLTALALAGCGGGDPVEVPDRTVEISIDDYRYEPQDVRVQRGRVTFRVSNDASEPHNFQIRNDAGRKGRISTLKPGASGTLTVRLRPGTYVVYCGIGRHEVLGEYGAVTVGALDVTG